MQPRGKKFNFCLLWVLKNFSMTLTAFLGAQRLSSKEGSIVQWLAYLLPDPAALVLNHGAKVFFQKKF